jgi:3-hydroxyacyl-[acyl-carrier-protein] dehydratase
MKLNKKKILEVQKNRHPYLLIDYASKVIPGKLADGYKLLKKNEWFFKVHWPGDPNMPGMLQVEALVQMASLSILSLPGNKGKILYLTHANEIRFLKKIIPNDKLEIKTKLKSFKRGLAQCEGYGFVKKKLVCSAQFTLILPDLIKSYKLKTL